MTEENSGLSNIHSNDLLDADSFHNLLCLVRQVIDAAESSRYEHGIIVKSKAAWKALENASNFYLSNGI